jgi:Na+/proline symporter
MKVLKILLGAFFALWLLGMLPFCAKQLVSGRSIGEWALNASTSVIALLMVGVFSFWSFQSAFKKPIQQEAEEEKT